MRKSTLFLRTKKLRICQMLGASCLSRTHLVPFSCADRSLYSRTETYNTEEMEIICGKQI